jgi:hypothetical protein
LKPPPASGVLTLQVKRLVAIACLVILIGASLFLVLRPAQPAPVAPVIVMPLPYRIPPQKVSLFERWAPRQPSWNWLWRVKETVVGRRKVCDLGATVVDFAGTGEAFLINHPLPAPAFTDAKGLRIWLLSEEEMSALGRNLRQQPGSEILYIPRIMTADGMQASLFAGGTFPIRGSQTPVGLAIDFLPRVRPNGTDVTTIMSLTEAITNQASTTAGSPPVGAVCVQTNFEAVARIQIPKGSGVFLLEGPPTGTNQKRIGVVLSVSTQKPK